MPEHHKDKIIVITGAASGIGKATAHTLDALGTKLVLCDINADTLKQLEQELESADKVKHTYFAIDIALGTDCDSLVAFLTSSFGKIDGLFNCAGINPTYFEITNATDEYFTRLVDVNIRGTFNMTRACVPLMRQGSSIVNVSSICGLRGYPGYSVYCATKFAIVGLTKSLALELGPKGIRVNAVAPGPTDTPTGDANEQTKERIALGRVADAAEIANVVEFLFSPQSSYMNGSIVEITGGMK